MITDYLKIGDEVAEAPQFGPADRISRITKITPTFQVTTSTGNRYTRNGRAIGFSGWLVPVTPELRAWVRHDKLVRRVHTRTFEEWSRLTTAQLEIVIELLEKSR